jgi:S1-C subfamily serine protease
MNKHFCLLFSFFSLLIISFIGISSAQPPSLIDMIIGAKESMVTVDAIQNLKITDDNAKNGRRGFYIQNGAGVIISPDGIIVTNFHTIYGSDHIKVTFNDRSWAYANIIRLLPQYDLALLQTEKASKFQPLVFADSDSIELGEEVINIGHSDLLNGTLSAGNIIGLGRKMNVNGNSDQSVQIIKTDIVLRKGDSGGPVLDRSGKLIGMIYAQIQSSGNPTLAIPSNKIKKLYLEFLKERYNAE